MAYSPNRLRLLRHARRLSISDVSSLTGVSRAQISKIENGKVDPRISTLESLLGCLGYSLSDVDLPRPVSVDRQTALNWSQHAAKRIEESGFGGSDPWRRLDRKDRLGADTSVEREVLASHEQG